jgi:hypothetical protein
MQVLARRPAVNAVCFISSKDEAKFDTFLFVKLLSALLLVHYTQTRGGHLHYSSALLQTYDSVAEVRTKKVADMEKLRIVTIGLPHFRNSQGSVTKFIISKFICNSFKVTKFVITKYNY